MAHPAPGDALLPLHLPNTIDKKEAVDNAQYWRDMLKGFFDNDKIFRAFYIPVIDIQYIAQMHNVSAVRGYIALGAPGQLTSVKMLIVPVGDDGKDMLTAPGFAEPSMSTIYDFTQPCPTQCDVDSELYNGYQ